MHRSRGNGLASNTGSVRDASWIAALCLSASLLAGNAHAGRLQVVVTGQGAPAADAVVSLHSPAAVAATRAGRATIDQRASQFVPRVTVVTVGTPVVFPNSDNVRHQVYSFSPAKRFELPLYSGKPAAPVVFATPGVVELGCNIHDWMLAYVVVVDTPYFAMANAQGRVGIDAPAGTYTLRVWHPRGPDQVEVWAFCITDKAASDEVKAAFENSATRAFGPAGFLEQDDSENWCEIQKLLKGHRARNTKLCLEMGLGQEKRREDGIPGITNYIFSETAARGMYQRWADLLSSESWQEVHEKTAAYQQEVMK